MHQSEYAEKRPAPSVHLDFPYYRAKHSEHPPGPGGSAGGGQSRRVRTLPGGARGGGVRGGGAGTLTGGAAGGIVGGGSKNALFSPPGGGWGGYPLRGV